MIGAPMTLVMVCFAVLSSTTEASTLQANSRFLSRPEPKPRPCPLPENAKWCKVGGLGKPFQMAVEAQLDDASQSICDTGTFKLREADLVVRSLGPAGRALDIGANLGLYSFALANRGWNVTAFELSATESAFMEATMCKNPKLAKKITLNKFGLGAKNEHCIMFENEAGDAQTKCGEDAASFQRIDHQPSKGLIPSLWYHEFGAFEMRRLDDVLSEQAIKHIDFVKMDVDGDECQVMAGGQSLLTNLRPRLIESAVLQTMQGCDETDYLTKFAKAGYTVSSDRADSEAVGGFGGFSEVSGPTVWLHRQDNAHKVQTDEERAIANTAYVKKAAKDLAADVKAFKKQTASAK